MYARPSRATTSSEETIQIADWIELNVLTEEESAVSLAEVTAMIAADPPDDSTTSEHRLDYPAGLEDLDRADMSPGYWEQAENTAESAFLELRQRSEWFGARYPLTVNGESATASSCFDSGAIASFLTLLRSRHLYHHALGDDGEVAGELFEELLPHVLRGYLGTNRDSSIRFGVSGGSRGSELPLQTDDALDELSRRMHEPRGNLTGLPNGRDYGGDGIAWKALGDSHPGKLVAIGQATISQQEWPKKHPSPKWKSGALIKFLTQPTIVIAFVESISLITKAERDGLPEEFSALPFDRFRILYILRDRDLPSSLRKRMENWTGQMLERLRQ